MMPHGAESLVDPCFLSPLMKDRNGGRATVENGAPPSTGSVPNHDSHCQGQSLSKVQLWDNRGNAK